MARSPSALRPSILLPSLAVVAALSLPAAAFVEPREEALRAVRELDVRLAPLGAAAARPELGAAQHDALRALRATFGEEVVAHTSPVGNGTLHFLTHRGGTLSPPRPGPAPVVAREFLGEHRVLLGIPAPVLDELVVEEVNGGKHERFTRVVFAQLHAGIPVYPGQLHVVLDRSGAVLAVGGELAVDPPAELDAELTPRAAVERAVAHVLSGRSVALRAAALDRHGRHVFSAAAFARPLTVARVLFPMAGGDRLAWRVEGLEPVGLPAIYGLVVDALTGEVLRVVNRVNYHEEFLVYDEHPDAGGQLRRGNGGDTTASPDGWVFASQTTGNNVDAYDDSGGTYDGRRAAVNESDTHFVHPTNLSVSPTTLGNKDAGITNLFYWNNVAHDWLYDYGFTESWRNFQEDNFGRGGLGSDSVDAEAQDGSGVNNANFFAPSDGQNPRMQMYIFTGPNPDRDGDLDTDVILHEYGHGLSIRIVGSMSGTQGGALGEGLSDVLAIVYHDQDAVGEYVMNNTVGIRRWAYEGYAAHATYGDLCSPSCQVHNDGEIFAAAMWEAWKLYKANLGVAAGRDALMLDLVGGLKLAPSNPDFLEMRDAILSANTDSDQECWLWEAFAELGMGENASTNGGSGTSDGFLVPPSCSGGGGTCGGPVYSSTDVPKSIPDNDATGVTSVLPVSGAGSAITELDVCVDITHTYIGDLEVVLESPAGTMVQLHARSGGSADDIVTCYDAQTNPAEPLSVLDGQNPNGTWSLMIRDRAAQDLGTLNSWSLEICTTGGGDVTPPSVTNTSAACGSTVSGTVTLTATASDDVAVDRVEFLVDGAVVGTDSTAPYSASWNTTTVGDGSHTVTARAVDTSGNAATDACATTVANDPGGGGCGSWPSGDVPKAIPDNDGGGVTSVTAVSGAGTTLSEVDVCVDITHTWIGDLIVTVTSPAGTSVVLHNRTGSSADDIVTCYDAQTTPAEPLSAFVGQNPNGTWSLKVQDLAGQDVGTLNTWSLELCTDGGGGGDVTPPSVTNTSAACGSTVSGTVTLTATASDDVAVDRVEFLVDGAIVGTDFTAPYSTSWNTTSVGDGGHTVTARAVDTSSNSATDACSTTVANGGGGGVIASEDFDPTAWSWFYVSGQTATTGLWSIGDPVATFSGSTPAQPGDDHTVGGVNALVTDWNNTSLGGGDVDGGWTSVYADVSVPTGTTVKLRYWRWVYRRDDDGDNADYFVSRYSLDGGASYIVLEDLTNVNANSWVQYESPAIATGGSSSLRVRFSCSDGPSAGNIVECLVDDIEVIEP